MMDLIEFIFKNQIVAEDWVDISESMPLLLGNHANLIRLMSMYVSEGKAGSGETRKALLGIYYDEVQEKITWAYNAARDVWAGKYPSGEQRKVAFGADYDLVQYWVNQLRPAVFVPDNLKYSTDMSGKRYLIRQVPSAKGSILWKGYDQHNQGSNPYVFDGSGCGFMSFYAVISTIKGYNITPQAYADKYLKTVTGGSKCPISIWAGCKLLENEGIRHEWIKGPLTTEGCKNDIQAHLEKGLPVIISLSIFDRDGKAYKGRYTNYAHYAIVIGSTQSGKWYLLDSGGQKPRYVDPADMCRFIPGTVTEPKYDPVWNGFNNAAGYVKIYM